MSPRMRFSFRFTLLTVLAGLLVLTISALEANSVASTRYIVDDLSSQLFQQVFSRIEQRVELQMDQVDSQAHINRKLIEKRFLAAPDGRLSGSDLDWICGYLHDSMELHPHLTEQSFTVEATGEYCAAIRRDRDWRPPASAGEALPGLPQSLLQVRVDAAHRRLLTESFVDQRGKLHRFRSEADTTFDPRSRPRHRDMVERWRSSKRTSSTPVKDWWTGIHRLEGVGTDGQPGMLLLSALELPGGRLAGILDETFNVESLQEYLGSFDLGTEGFVFLIERASDGLHVITPRTPSASATFTVVTRSSEITDARVRCAVENVLAVRNDGGEGAASLQCTFQGQPQTGGIRRIGIHHGLDWRVCVMLPRSYFLRNVTRREKIAVSIAAACIAIALLLGFSLSGLVAHPLVRLVRDVDAIGHLALEPGTRPRSRVVEVSRLEEAVESMKTSLRSFRKYVPAELVRRVLDSGQEARLGGERREITVYFSDIANFTSLAEHEEPERLVETLGEYLGSMSDEIVAQAGTVDKYIGDAIMAFWGAPQPVPGHAVAACRTALRCQRRMAELQGHWQQQGRPVFSCRIGLHTGEAVVGNLGSELRLDYTAIGDTVNLASRLEGLNKFYRTSILVSQATVDAAGDQVRTRPVDRVAVKGRRGGVVVHELLAMREDDTPELARLASLSTAALGAYLQRDWAGALKAWEEVLAVRPGDHAATLLASRCRQHLESPPPVHWDGAWQMEHK